MASNFFNHKKKQFLEKLLDGDYVLVHLFPSEKGVALPDDLKKNSTVTLKLSYRFRGELRLEEDEILSDLRFGDDYFPCRIPYSAIWACTSESGEMQLWSDNQERIKLLMSDMVKTVETQSEQTQSPTVIDQAKTKKTKKRQEKKKGSAEKGSSHLKRIK